MSDPMGLCLESLAEDLERDLKGRGKGGRGRALSRAEILQLGNYRLLWRYQPGRLPKSDGSFREVSIPVDAVMWMSRRLYPLLWERFKPELPPCVWAYVPDRSHMGHALAHRASKWIWLIDLEDAFPSVTYTRLRKKLLRYLTIEDAAYVAGLACDGKGRLVQGNPLSPLLYLIATADLTREISALAEAHGLVVTIYADDLAISGKRVLPRVKDEVLELIRKAGFKPHELGTNKNRVLKRKDGGAVIAGIDVSGSEPRLPVMKRMEHWKIARKVLSGVCPPGLTPEQVSGILRYTVGMNRRLKLWLRKELSDPAKRELLAQALDRPGHCLSRSVRRAVRNPMMAWERYLP